MSKKYGLKDIAKVTFYNPKTGEELVWDKDRQKMVGTGVVIVDVERKEEGEM